MIIAMWARRSFNVFWMALLALCIVVLLVGCEPGEGTWVGPWDPNDSSTAHKPKVAMIGDSLVDCCDEEWVDSYLPQTYPFAMWSIGGTKLGGNSKPWLQQLAPRPDVVIIAQGTNNIGDGAWGTDDQQALTSTLAAVSDADCVVMVNYGWAPGASASYIAGATQANAALTAMATTDPRYRVSNWRGWSYYNPAWFASTDYIHHTPTGSSAYIFYITKTVKEIIAARGCL